MGFIKSDIGVVGVSFFFLLLFLFLLFYFFSESMEITDTGVLIMN